MIELACATGIAPSAWWAEPERAIFTALEVMSQDDDGGSGRRTVASG